MEEKAIDQLELGQLKVKLIDSITTTLVWPSVTTENKPGFEKDIPGFFEFLRKNKIERLLIDSRKSKIHIPYQEHMALIKEFTIGLLSTDVKRVARAKSKDPMENMTVTPGEVPSYDTEYPMEWQEFEDIGKARSWLALPVKL